MMIGRKRKSRRNVYKAGVRRRRQDRMARIRQMALIVGGLLLFAVFNLALILTHDWITQTSLLPIETVQVKGARRLADEIVRQRAGIAMEGNILAVNLGRARRRLQAHPWVAEARVMREIPTGIVIRIREHDCAASPVYRSQSRPPRDRRSAAIAKGARRRGTWRDSQATA